MLGICAAPTFYEKVTCYMDPVIWNLILRHRLSILPHNPVDSEGISSRPENQSLFCIPAMNSITNKPLHSPHCIYRHTPLCTL
jgi:hypothetical protein